MTKKIITTIILTEELYNKLRKKAFQENKSKSEIIRKLIKEIKCQDTQTTSNH